MKKQIEIDDEIAELIDSLIRNDFREHGEPPGGEAFDRLVTILSNEFPECGILETKQRFISLGDR